jgi:hypothetical protein
MADMYDDQYSDDAQDVGLMIIWRCDKCGAEREDYPGYNQGGQHYCGGEWVEHGESYACED